jgi:hypothetical protein
MSLQEVLSAANELWRDVAASRRNKTARSRLYLPETGRGWVDRT